MKKLVIKPPALIMVSATLTVLACFIFPEGSIFGFPWNLLGIAVSAAGVGLNIHAWSYFQRAGTPENYDRPTALVAEGPYRYSRNPMLVGGILLVTGFWVLSGNIYSLISPFLFTLILVFYYIPFEEEMMEDIFGQEYKIYKNAVRRWF